MYPCQRLSSASKVSATHPLHSMTNATFRHRILLAIIVIFFLIAVVLLADPYKQGPTERIKLGFIGAMSGPVAKYGSYEAARLAAEEINANGGINGTQIELIAEDGKCNSSAATNAANKLINIDNVNIILGGHCTPESIAIAPIAEKNNVIMLASITTSPALTPMGDYVFRTSPVSIVQSHLIADVARNTLGLETMAIIYEQTDYASPIAERLKEEFVRLGGLIELYEGYAPGVTDFRTLLTKAKAEHIDALFLSAQSPDAALNFMKQVNEIGIKAQLFGNDVAGIPVNIRQIPNLYEGFILALPDFDTENQKTKRFIERYNAAYGTQELPYGFYTAESADAVYLITDAIAENGLDIERIRKYLYQVKQYEGISGPITIDQNGDGVREYSLKTVRNGTIIPLEK